MSIFLDGLQVRDDELKYEYSSDTLNEVIDKLEWQISCNNKYSYINLVIELLSIPGFEPNEELRKKLSNSMYYPILFLVAESDRTSFEILKDMFFRECSQFLYNNYSDLLDAIIQNPNFIFDNNFNHELEAKFKPDYYYRILEKIETLKIHKK